MEIWKLAVYVIKLLSKDLEYLKEIAQHLDVNLLTNVDNLIRMQQAQQQKAEEEKKLKEMSTANNVNNNVTPTQTISENTASPININKDESTVSAEKSTTGGPKLKALKFKK
jgi:hypothetical protein